MRAVREQLQIPAASVGNRAPAVLRRGEQRRSSLRATTKEANHARCAATPRSNGPPSRVRAADRGQQHQTRRRPGSIEPMEPYAVFFGRVLLECGGAQLAGA